MVSEAVSKRVRCVVVTPETTVLDAEADFVAFPAYDGEVGILPGRSPLVARLGAGELRLVDRGKPPRRYFIDSGFGQIRDNVVTLLTARCKAAAELETGPIEQQLKETAAEVPTGDEALADRLKRQERLRAQRRLAEPSRH